MRYGIYEHLFTITNLVSVTFFIAFYMSGLSDHRCFIGSINFNHKFPAYITGIIETVLEFEMKFTFIKCVSIVEKMYGHVGLVLFTIEVNNNCQHVDEPEVLRNTYNRQEVQKMNAKVL